MPDRSNPKRLLTFAHKGEAQELIKKSRFKPLEFYFSGVYESECEWLLITGEGLQSATERVAAVCAALRDKISEVVNLGIAGSLDEQLYPGKIYSIRTVYGEKDNGVNFKSFTTTCTDTTIDCISASDRVLDREYANRLAPFAPLVDRELWAIASVCNLFNLPLRAYKLISDAAGGGTDCEDLKGRAAEFSSQLWQFYQKMNFPGSRREPTPGPLLPEGFHVTVSQERQLQMLLRNLEIKLRSSKSEILKRVNIAEILETEAIPKKRTTILLERLGNLLNPFHLKLKNRLDTLCLPLSAVNCRVQFDRDYESDAIGISVRIHNERHLQDFQSALQEFPYREMIAIMNGDVPVTESG